MNQQLQTKINELISQYDPINSRNSGRVRTNDRNTRDCRIPVPGTTIHKEYKGSAHTILVLKDGFEYQHQRFKSLSSIAKRITGSHWNGFNFFGLEK